MPKPVDPKKAAGGAEPPAGTEPRPDPEPPEVEEEARADAPAPTEEPPLAATPIEGAPRSIREGASAYGVFQGAPPPNPVGVGEDDDEIELEPPSEAEANPVNWCIPDVKVVYRGNNPNRTVRYRGSQLGYELAPGRVIWVPSEDGATTYNFQKYDARMRPQRSRMTKEGFIFDICRDITHVVRFMHELDASKAPEFRIRCDRATGEKIMRYARLLKRAEKRNLKSGPALVAAMADAFGQ